MDKGEEKFKKYEGLMNRMKEDVMRFQMIKSNEDITNRKRRSSKNSEKSEKDTKIATKKDFLKSNFLAIKNSFSS